ncbi:hypothetical protein K438DRAFT_1974028 [Mycena galopus ATCC 62051]|nr:hypothetical protein K438DRAFT_1974028 [Mycena galopus ATCC 62051]
MPDLSSFSLTRAEDLSAQHGLMFWTWRVRRESSVVATQTLLSRIPETTPEEFESAVEAAMEEDERVEKAALCPHMMQALQALIRENMDTIATAIVLEQGKTFTGAALFFTPKATSSTAAGRRNSVRLPHHPQGETLEVSKDMDTEIRKVPCRCAVQLPHVRTPFLLTPLHVTGNTLIKPSERDPGARMFFSEPCVQAPPPGALDVVHGTVLTVNAICTYTLIRALSFVGRGGINTSCACPSFALT